MATKGVVLSGPSDGIVGAGEIEGGMVAGDLERTRIAAGWPPGPSSSKKSSPS